MYLGDSNQQPQPNRNNLERYRTNPSKPFDRAICMWVSFKCFIEKYLQLLQLDIYNVNISSETGKHKVLNAET